MPQLDRKEESNSFKALVARTFSRCSNWREGATDGLTAAFQRAGNRFGFQPEEIVAKCSELSTFAPTDHDVAQVASEMWEVRNQAKAGDTIAAWRKQYGEPAAGTGPICLHCGKTWAEIGASKRELAVYRRLLQFAGKKPDHREAARIASWESVGWGTPEMLKQYRSWYGYDSSILEEYRRKALDFLRTEEHGA